MQYSKIIFDLDYTLLPSAKYNQDFKKGIYENLKFIPEALSVLEILGKENCILLTYDKYGDQQKKLDHLQAIKYFKQIIVVDDNLKKYDELERLQAEFGNVLVVGDRYDEGELYHAGLLGLDTVCVALPGTMYPASEHHQKFNLVIGSKKDFNMLLKMVYV